MDKSFFSLTALPSLAVKCMVVGHWCRYQFECDQTQAAMTAICQFGIEINIFIAHLSAEIPKRLTERVRYGFNVGRYVQACRHSSSSPSCPGISSMFIFRLILFHFIATFRAAATYCRGQSVSQPFSEVSQASKPV